MKESNRSYSNYSQTKDAQDEKNNNSSNNLMNKSQTSYNHVLTGYTKGNHKQVPHAKKKTGKKNKKNKVQSKRNPSSNSTMIEEEEEIYFSDDNEDSINDYLYTNENHHCVIDQNSQISLSNLNISSNELRVKTDQDIAIDKLQDKLFSNNFSHLSYDREKHLITVIDFIENKRNKAVKFKFLGDNTTIHVLYSTKELEQQYLLLKSGSNYKVKIYKVYDILLQDDKICGAFVFLGF